MKHNTPKKYASLDEAIREIFGEKAAIKTRTPVHGGDINDAYCIALANGEEAFLKTNSRAKEDFFAAEAAGLAALKSAGANTPDVLGWGETGGGGFLLLGCVRSSKKRSAYWEELGHMLAQVHQAATAPLVPGGSYGFSEDNYIGNTRQKNAPCEGWVDFFRERRLGFQMQLAAPYLGSEDMRRARYLLGRLGSLLAEPGRPSLLHGDLWGGNVMADEEGRAMLIDPAVYVGHSEADIAMTELFGGFPPRFYAAYHEAVPREPGYDERREIYNLYHLLNHLNLFGASYLPPVRRILEKYAG